MELVVIVIFFFFFFFQAEDGIRDKLVTGVQTCALPISRAQHQPVDEFAGRLFEWVAEVLRATQEHGAAIARQPDGVPAERPRHSHERARVLVEIVVVVAPGCPAAATTPAARAAALRRGPPADDRMLLRRLAEEHRILMSRGAGAIRDDEHLAIGGVAHAVDARVVLVHDLLAVLVVRRRPQHHAVLTTGALLPVARLSGRVRTRTVALRAGL